VNHGVAALIADIALGLVNNRIEALVMFYGFERIMPALGRLPRTLHRLQPVAEQRFSEHLLSALRAVAQGTVAGGAIFFLHGGKRSFPFTG